MGAADAQIRSLLLADLRATHPAALIVQEWSIPGSHPPTVADVGLVRDDAIDGFEIKSAADSLVRLERQVPNYGRAFSTCTMVTAANHARRARETLPAWWGITIATADALHVDRAPKANPDPHPVVLLWAKELSTIARARGVMARVRAEKREEYRGHNPGSRYVPAPGRYDIAKALDGIECAKVCEVIRARSGWLLPDGHSVRGAELRRQNACPKCGGRRRRCKRCGRLGCPSCVPAGCQRCARGRAFVGEWEPPR